jgi:hypothetical protein
MNSSPSRRQPHQPGLQLEPLQPSVGRDRAHLTFVRLSDPSYGRRIGGPIEVGTPRIRTPGIRTTRAGGTGA